MNILTHYFAAQAHLPYIPERQIHRRKQFAALVELFPIQKTSKAKSLSISFEIEDITLEEALSKLEESFFEICNTKLYSFFIHTRNGFSTDELDTILIWFFSKSKCPNKNLYNYPIEHHFSNQEKFLKFLEAYIVFMCDNFSFWEQKLPTIQDKTFLYSLCSKAISALQENALALLELFQLDKNNLYSIGLLACAEMADSLPRYFGKFAILSDLEKCELIDRILEKTTTLDKAVFKHFHLLKIESPAIRHRYAKGLLVSNPSLLTSTIDHFQIEKEDDRFDIAMQLASKYGYSIAKEFTRFKIENPEFVNDIASACFSDNQGVNKNANAITYIRNFGIKDQSLLEAFFVVAAYTNGTETAEAIDEELIPNQEKRFEIMRGCCMSSIHRHVSKFLSSFNLSVSQQKEIIDISLTHSPDQLAKYLYYYTIDPLSICPLIDLLAVRGGKGLTKSLPLLVKKYPSLKKNGYLFQIASKIVEHYPLGFKKLSQLTTLFSESELVSLAIKTLKRQHNVVLNFVARKELQPESSIAIIKKATCLLRKDFIGIRQFYAKMKSEKNEEIKCAVKELVKRNIVLDPDQDYRDFINFIEHSELMWFWLAHGFKIESRISIPHIRTEYSLLVTLQEIIEDHKISMMIKSDIPKEKNAFEFCTAFRKDYEERLTTSLSPNVKQTLDIVFDQSNPKTTDLHIKNNLTFFLKSLFLLGCHKSLLTQLPEKVPFIESVINKCLSIHNPRIRRFVVSAAWRTLENNASYELFQRERSKIKEAHFFLPQITTAFLVERGVSPEFISKQILLPLYKMKDAIKDLKLRNEYYLFLELLDQYIDLTKHDLTQIFFWIFESPNKSEVIQKLRLLHNICEMSDGSGLKKKKLLAHKEGLDRYFMHSFQKKIPIANIPHFYEKYMACFGNSRDPTAVLRYASSLQRHPYPTRAKAIKTFTSFIEHALMGTESFKHWRFSTHDNPHLKQIIEARPDILELWQQDFSQEFTYIADEAITPAKPDLKKFFTDKILIDKHIHLPLVEEYLSTGNHDPSLPITKENKAEIALIQTMLPSFDTLSKEKQIGKIRAIGKWLNLPQNSPFLNDLKFLESQIIPPKIELSTYKLEFGCDPVDLLLCGTDIKVSCQSIDGHYELNLGLLGYLADGKNQLLCIKDKDGMIQFRILLRLMWDPVEKKTLLFMSRLYYNQWDQELANKLLNFTIHLANELKLDLVSVEVSLDGVKSNAYPNPVVALQGKSPFEYVDEAAGITQGAYTTRPAHYIKKYEPLEVV